MIRVESTSRKGGYGLFQGYGPDLVDLADELLDEVEPRAKEAVRDARDIVLGEAKRLLSLRTSGLPTEGQPPVRRTSELYRSLRKLAVSVRGRVISAGFSTAHPGASRLEYGFVDKLGRRTLPHPWLRPAFENTRDQVERRLAEL